MCSSQQDSRPRKKVNQIRNETGGQSDQSSNMALDTRCVVGSVRSRCLVGSEEQMCSW